MLAAERQSKILEIIQSRGSVQVEDLAKELEVSPMTIRRDFMKLEDDQRIQRCHGGAIARQEMTYVAKQEINIEEKEKLAQASAVYVSPRDTVFLDAGTTTYEIAKLIMNIPEILIVTNDLEIARLVNTSNAELVMCGGRVQKSTGSVLGYYTTNMLKDYRFDIGFFGAASINSDYEVMTPTTDKAFLKREAFAHCERTYLVVDDSKFNKNSLKMVNDLGDFTAVITDKKFTLEEERTLREKDVNIVLV